MKILISRKDLKDTTSGVPKKVLQELQFFHQKGHSSYAIAETINQVMVNEFGGIPIKTWRWPISGHFRRRVYSYQVQKWINKNKPDIVIGHGDILHQDILFIHNCVHLASELVDKKSLPPDHEVGQIHQSILTSGSYKLLICNSQMMKNDLSVRFGLNEQKIRVIYPELNVNKFIENNISASRKSWRSKFGFNSDDVVIGLITSGNFKKRNLGLLLEAYGNILSVFPKAKLFIAGGNIDQTFKDQAQGLNVVFAPSIIDVKNYFNLIDIFVLPAFIEEFGRSVLEAMFTSKPVITSKFVGSSEILERESQDFILQELTKEELSRKLLILLNSVSLRSALGQINHDVAKKYSSESQNKLFAKFLDEFNIFKG